MIIQKKLAQASINYLSEKYSKEQTQNEHLDNLLSKLQSEFNFFQQDFDDENILKEK